MVSYCQIITFTLFFCHTIWRKNVNTDEERHHKDNTEQLRIQSITGIRKKGKIILPIGQQCVGNGVMLNITFPQPLFKVEAKHSLFTHSFIMQLPQRKKDNKYNLDRQCNLLKWPFLFLKI